MFTYLRNIWRLNVSVLIWFVNTNINNEKVFKSIIVLLLVWHWHEYAQLWNYTGTVPANFGTATTFLKWTQSQKQTGFLSYMGSRLNLGYRINICSPVHSLGISCSFHLSLSFNCILFCFVWPHNKQMTGIYCTKNLSLIQTCFSIDQNWFLR